MALSTEIIGILWEQGKYSLESSSGFLGNEWELIGDPRFRNVSQNPSYRDYMAILTVREALDMARRCYGDGGYKDLEKSLRKASFVLIHIYEWESGM